MRFERFVSLFEKRSHWQRVMSLCSSSDFNRTVLEKHSENFVSALQPEVRKSREAVSTLIRVSLPEHNPMLAPRKQLIAYPMHSNLFDVRSARFFVLANVGKAIVDPFHFALSKEDRTQNEPKVKYQWLAKWKMIFEAKRDKTVTIFILKNLHFDSHRAKQFQGVRTTTFDGN